MKIIKKIKNVFWQAINSNSSPRKLALSFCVGIYIAFSPFPGGHTVIMLALNWLLRLNFPVLFVATSFNNPWTMVPFFALDYSFGYWLIHSFFGWNSLWVISLERFFSSGKICLLSFLLGGNILAIIAALLSYPFALWLFKRFSTNVDVAS